MKIAVVIGIALLLILLMPIAAIIQYHGAFNVYVGLFAPFWKIYPLKKKETKKNKRPKKEKNQNEKVKQKLDRSLIFGLLKKFPGYFKRLLVIRKIELNALVGNEDPGDLALTYGAIHAGLSTASSVLDFFYPVEKWKVRVEADFEKEATEIDGKIEMHTNILRILAVLISFGIYVILNNSNEKETIKNGK